MTAAELRVLEARMDMLDAMLQDLIDQMRRTQPPAWTDQVRRAVSGLPGVPVFQGFFRWLRTGSKMVPPMSSSACPRLTHRTSASSWSSPTKASVPWVGRAAM
jgi:hypothetical protein